MLLDLLAIFAGFSLLLWGAERFITGAAALARNLGVSPMLIGLTIVGFGTSAPEILVSVMAVLQGNSGLAIGNAIGSNIANIGLILGVTALVVPLTVDSATLRREYPMLLAISLLTLALMWDGSLSLFDGVVLVVALITVLYSMVRIGRQSRASDPMEGELESEIPSDLSSSRAAFLFLSGLLVLLIGSRMLVWGAVNIATALGVSDLVIGLTIVALGTSLPELAASIVSALKREHDIAIGNVIGSNIYNLLAVLSIPGLMAPGPFSPDVLSRDLPVMLVLTFALLLMSYGFRGPGRINRLEAALLLGGFIAYQALLFHDAKPSLQPTSGLPTIQEGFA
jgi:cation:H+ antiporter